MTESSDAALMAAAIVYGIAGRPLAGEAVSGDLHLIAPLAGGVLVAVADGLGHGYEAAHAAQAAVDYLRRNLELPLADLMQRCDGALRRTRGVVLGLAAFHFADDRLDWIGVGNIDAVLIRADPFAEPRRRVLPNRGGVVGLQMPQLRGSSYPMYCGDVLTLATDGINGDLPLSQHAGLGHWSPQELADYLIDHHARANDDALAVVVRYRGLQSAPGCHAR